MIDKGLALFTSWEDEWLMDSNSIWQPFMGCKVSVNVFGCSIDDYTTLLHRTQFYANSVDFIEITLHSMFSKP